VTDRSPLPSFPAPGLAFLELGERLRQRGQLEAAVAVAQAGLTHYPLLADAHDLLGRIRVDQGQEAAAVAAWHAAIECEPTHVGARKGLAYVAFRSKDFTTAEHHLELALRDAPHDATVLAALDRVRSAGPATSGDAVPRVDDPASGLLVLDALGMRLAGGLGPEQSDEAADAVAAEAAGVRREADRAVRLLGLGGFRHLVVEDGAARFALFPVTADVTLVLRRTPSTPVGRLVALGQRAVDAAREWLGRLT
jgi:tetratricopeptide (TPR) repeat protein